jgi:hypothetical protein
MLHRDACAVGGLIDRISQQSAGLVIIACLAGGAVLAFWILRLIPGPSWRRSAFCRQANWQ